MKRIPLAIRAQFWQCLRMSKANPMERSKPPIEPSAKSPEDIDRLWHTNGQARTLGEIAQDRLASSADRQGANRPFQAIQSQGPDRDRAVSGL